MLNLLCSLEMKQWSLDDNTSVYNMRERERANEVTQLCPTLCDHLDCSLPGFSIHGIFQARVLEWFAISLSRGSSQPRDRTQVSHIAGRCFTLWATREAPNRREWTTKWMLTIITFQEMYGVAQILVLNKIIQDWSLDMQIHSIVRKVLTEVTDK